MVLEQLFIIGCVWMCVWRMVSHVIWVPMSKSMFVLKLVHAFLAARALAALTLVAVMAAGASSGAVAVIEQQSEVCSGVADVPTMGYIVGLLAIVFFVGLTCGTALACCCLQPWTRQRPTASDNVMVVTLEKASQSQVTYTRNASQPRFKPLAESAHG